MTQGFLKHTRRKKKSFKKVYLVIPSPPEEIPSATELCAVNLKYNQIGFRNTNGDFIEEPLLQQLRKLHLIFF